MAGLRGAGKVYLNPLSGGTYGGFLDMSNIASFTIGNSGADTKTIKSTAPVNYGAIIGSSTTPGDDTVKIELNVPNRKNLTTMLLGTDSTVTVSGTTITQEAHTAKKGAYLVLAKRKLSSFTLLDNSGTSGTPYTLGTDYTVADLDNGLIYIPTTSSIVDGATVYADYVHGAYSGYKIDARTQSSVICKMLFVGKNLDNGEFIRLSADSVELSPDGDFSLISADGDFLSFSLSGTIKVPEGQTVPFTVEVNS